MLAAVSDTFEPAASSEPSSPQGLEVEIDVAAFLPDDAEPVRDVEIPDDPPAHEEQVEPAPSAPTAAAGGTVDVEALSQIERDLDAVDAAIAALDAGTYGVDPVTGQPISDALLAENPTRLS